MKQILKLTTSLLLVIGLSTSLFANGLSLNSVGPKAIGMGGAFVALSNDATAMYWNPAGLAGQSTSVSAYFTGVMPLQTYEYAPAMIDLEGVKNVHSTGGLFGVYASGNMTFGLGVYVPAGLGAEFNGTDLVNLQQGNKKWESKIGVVAISPSFAFQVNDKFSIGVAANIYYGMFDLSRPQKLPIPTPTTANPNAVTIVNSQYTEESTGVGFGATIGLMYDISEQLTIGASFRTSTAVSMEGDAVIDNADFPIDLGTLVDTKFEREVTWPLWIGGGLAYKPTECLTLVLDAQYSKWSLLDELIAEYEKMPDGEFTLNWEDAVQIRLGGEYMVSPKTAIRLGYYYDPAPAPDETLNILFPSSTNHVVTAGFGHSFGKYRIDAAAEYLLGADREVAPAADNMPGIHHLDVFAFSIGFGMDL